jgi:hypothetical protein
MGAVGGSGVTIVECEVDGSVLDGDVSVVAGIPGVVGTDGGNWLSAKRVPLAQAATASTTSATAGTRRIPFGLTRGA